MSGETFGYCMDKLFDLGAFDVYYTPIYMKKNRPAYSLTVLCDSNVKEAVIDSIFQETTTLGVRVEEIKRVVLPRELINVDTKYGSVKAKKYFTLRGDERISLEYDSIKDIAQKTGLPLDKIRKDIEKE